jgi:hypothetical protein
MVLVNFPSRNIFGIIHKIYIVNVGHPDGNIICSDSHGNTENIKGNVVIQSHDTTEDNYNMNMLEDIDIDVIT